MVGFYFYMAVDISSDELAPLELVLINVLLLFSLGVLYGAAALDENSWVGAICWLIIIIYGICTLGFGLVFLPAILLSIPITTIRSLFSKNWKIRPY